MWITITTLFNLFCPVVMFYSISFSILLLIFTTIGASLCILQWLKKLNLVRSLFTFNEIIFVKTLGFVTLIVINLISLAIYNYPVSTTLRFNLAMALGLWLIRMTIKPTKKIVLAPLLPENTPWYLIIFLSIIELTRVIMRPFTLCFRLLANIRAGHILLTLSSKLPNGAWCVRAPFGSLELVVSLVQAFVFITLADVYLEESLSH